MTYTFAHLQLSLSLPTKVSDVVPPTDVTEATSQRAKVNMNTANVAILLLH